MGRARVGNVSNRRRYGGIWITDYGAVGDGATNNTTAIRNAISAAAAAWPMMPPIFIPPGTYAHNNTLTIDSLTLYGCGDQSVLKPTAPLLSALMLAGDNPVAFNFKKNITSPGARQGANETMVIAASGVTNMTVMNIHAINSAGGGLYAEGTASGKIWSCVVETTNADGISLAGACSDIDIQYNYVNTTGDDGISINVYDGDPATLRTNIQNNTVIGNTGARSLGMDGGSTITVSGNHFENGTGLGVSGNQGWPTSASDHIVISGNTIKNQHIAGGSPPFDNVNGGAINLYNDRGDISAVMNNVTVTGNQFYNCEGAFCVTTGNYNIANTVSFVANDMYGTNIPIYTKYNSATVNLVNSGNVYHGTSYPGDVVPVVGGLDPAWRLVYYKGQATNRGYVVKWS